MLDGDKVDALTWIKLEFKDGDEIEVKLPTYVADEWINDEKTKRSIKKIATIVDWRINDCIRIDAL